MKAKGEIKNILFDLGNTLVYFDFWYFYDGVARLEKKLNPVKFKKFINESKFPDKLSMGKLKHKDFFKILKKKFCLKIGFDDFINLYVDIFWTNTNMKIFVEKLSKTKRFKMILLSNTDSYHIKFIDNNFPFVKLLKNRVLSFRVNSIKPQKKIFVETLRKYKLKSHETLLIDDMRPNIKAAQELGIKAIHYKEHRKFMRQFTKIV